MGLTHEQLRQVVHGPVWFTGCILNEGEIHILGPFFCREYAEIEAAGEGVVEGDGCKGAHLICQQVGHDVVVHGAYFAHAAAANETEMRVAWITARAEGGVVAGVINRAVAIGGHR